jgi:mRNA guanylyltransferase
MEVSYGVEMMFRDVLPNLPHGNDGLIFTCRTSQYKFGTDEKMYALHATTVIKKLTSPT